jgi:hypothetical protein
VTHSASWAVSFEAWEYGNRPMTASELMPIAENVLPEERIRPISGASAAASSWALGFGKSILPTTIPAHVLHGASCPLLQRHAAKTSNVWEQAVVAQDVRPSDRNIVVGAEESLE